MKHIKTIYLGCDSHQVATPSNRIIRFCQGTVYAHATIMNRLSSAMWEQQYLAEYTSIARPAKYCVLIPKQCANTPSKPENASTGLDTISWFIENLHPPRGGAIFSFYTYDETNTGLVGAWNAQVIWPLNKDRQWIGDEDYITLHDVEPAILGRRKGNIYTNHPTYEVIKNIDNICPYKVKRVDYTMTEEKIFETLKHSRLHIAYHGATVFTAGMINIPTICFGWPSRDRVGDWNNYGEVKTITVKETSWNNGTCNPVTQVHQYDWDKDRVMQAPQNYLINVNNPIELKSYIMGMQELKWVNRSYQL